MGPLLIQSEFAAVAQTLQLQGLQMLGLEHQMQRERAHQKRLEQALEPQKEWRVQGHRRALEQEHFQTSLQLQGRGRCQIILQQVLEHFRINPLQQASLRTQEQVPGFQMVQEQHPQTYHPLPVQGPQTQGQAQADQTQLALQTPARELAGQTPPSGRPRQMPSGRPPVDRRWCSSQTRRRLARRIPPLPARVPVGRIRQKEQGQERRREQGRGRRRERLPVPQTYLFN
mmetsp:Transcript_39301/g.82646  ORF Transcript_39301/g.82646 Transcript_39301/m.82646 type:complete len:229 (-) Transcript_39301:570-1256(-)